MEGQLLLEAEEDKYDLDNTDDSKGGNSDNQGGGGDTATSGTDSGSAPATGDDNADSGGDNTDNSTGTDDDSDGDSNYDLDDDGGGGDGSDSPATSDNVDGGSDGGGDTSTDDSSTPAAPLPGETLNIDPKTRAILAFKNFERYKDLRDDSQRLISELSEFIPINDEVRAAVAVAIEKGTDLVNKLTDYIMYKYSDTSYELNYYNFMQFLLEKRYIGELYDAIVKTSSQAKGNK
jgi:hypothetical protein